MQQINDHDLIPFNFEGVKLQEVCWMKGNPYFTGKSIGMFLEYKHPNRAIHKIVERNSHIKAFSTEVKLTSVDEYPRGHSFVSLTNESTTRNREIQVRVFDPIGLQLIINKSNQPKAVAFQIAAAHLVLAFMKGEIRPSRWSQKGDRISAIKQILSHPAGYSRAQLVRDLAARENVAVATAYEWIERLGKLKTKTGKPKRRRADAGTTKYPELRAAALFVKSQMPTYGPKRIAAIIGKPEFVYNVRHWIKAA